MEGEGALRSGGRHRGTEDIISDGHTGHWVGIRHLAWQHLELLVPNDLRVAPAALVGACLEEEELVLLFHAREPVGLCSCRICVDGLDPCVEDRSTWLTLRYVA